MIQQQTQQIEANSATTETTKITRARFNLPIYPRQVKHFRSAIVEMALRLKPVFERNDVPTDLFHNRDEQTAMQENHYRYPLIQYHIEQRKAVITGIGPGSEALQALIEYREPTITFSGEKHPLALLDKQEQQFSPVFAEMPVIYRIYKWLPLNANNYPVWNNTPTLAERAQLLERCLFGHVQQLLRAFPDPGVAEKLHVFMRTIANESIKTIHDKRMLALDATFGTNILLPENIGLGLSAAYGFGKIKLHDHPK